MHGVNLASLTPWRQDAADLKREEAKRWYSPASFFFSQGKAIVLAANYFRDARLTPAARGGVARKHRHRIYLALFGQLMASLEYFLKDFVAQVIDLSDLYDEDIRKAKWIAVETDQILRMRSSTNLWTGALLVHSTLGWHEVKTVNARYSELFKYQPIDPSEVATLERLWILRHSVAHNAGLILTVDAHRAGLTQLSDRVVDIDGEFLEETFEFLCIIAHRVASKIGDKILLEWLQSKRDSGQDFRRDKWTYTNLKRLSMYVPSRARPLPRVGKGDYAADFKRANP